MIIEKVKLFLDNKNISYFEGDDLIKFDVEGERGSWQTFVRVLEEESLVVIYSVLGYKVPTEKVQEAALLLTDLNFGLKIGNFELNRTNGEVHFKTYLNLTEDEINEKYIERTLFINIHTMDHYLPQILKATIA